TIGPAGATDVACVQTAAKPFVPRIEDADRSDCVYNGLSASFVIYRGQSPTVRDYEFDWTVLGGFTPELLNISATTDANTSPTSLAFSPGIDGLVIADGSSKGLVLVNLSTFGIVVNY